jgi:hypothetical protein
MGAGGMTHELPSSQNGREGGQTLFLGDLPALSSNFKPLSIKKAESGQIVKQPRSEDGQRRYGWGSAWPSWPSSKPPIFALFCTTTGWRRGHSGVDQLVEHLTIEQRRAWAEQLRAESDALRAEMEERRAKRKAGLEPVMWRVPEPEPSLLKAEVERLTKHFEKRLEEFAGVIGAEVGKTERAMREHFVREIGQLRADATVQTQTLRQQLKEAQAAVDLVTKGSDEADIPRFLRTDRHAPATH